MTKPIEVIPNPSQEELEALGVYDWPIWEKEVSTFPWTYDMDETCYFLEGSVTVTPLGGEPVFIEAGNLVRFRRGVECTWEVHQPIRKHYQFS